MNGRDPKVSIVIPTYNRVGFVEQAIMSVLEQDYENLELMVLDDGSEDDTPKLLERIAGREGTDRFSWDRHENAGQSATINRAFERMDGDLLGYLSSDDALLPGAITKLVAAAEENPDAEVIYPWYRLDALGSKPEDVITAVEHDFVDSLRWGLCVPGVGALVRRSYYERAGGWNESYRHSPDVDWWLRCPDAKFLQVPEELGVFTRHPGSFTTAMDRRDYLNERFAMLDAFFARDDLAPEILAVKEEAFGSLLIETGVVLYGDQAPDDPRWKFDDQLGGSVSRNQAGNERENHLALRWTNQTYGEQVKASQVIIEELSRAVGVLEDAAGWREQRIRRLEIRIAELEAAEPNGAVLPDTSSEALPEMLPEAVSERPAWKRAIRRLVPPPMRAPAVKFYRRLKGQA